VRKPIDRTLAAMWASYERAVIPPGTSAAAIRNNKFAFYGGASVVLDLLILIGGDDFSEHAAVAVIEELHRELRTFAADEEAHVKPGN
jgi:hypothetical protein